MTHPARLPLPVRIGNAAKLCQAQAPGPSQRERATLGPAECPDPDTAASNRPIWYMEGGKPEEP